MKKHIVKSESGKRAWFQGIYVDVYVYTDVHIVFFFQEVTKQIVAIALIFSTVTILQATIMQNEAATLTLHFF